MKASQFATLVGLLLGVVLAFGTLTQFFVVVLFTAIGCAVGLVLDGRIDISGLTGRRGR